MRKRNRSNKFRIFGESPLGYNGREATADGFAPVRNTDVIEVELFYDSRFDTEISKHAIVDKDNEDVDLIRGDICREEESFRRSIGIT